jgi:Ca2+-binding EF-hand superfamily protein
LYDKIEKLTEKEIEKIVKEFDENKSLYLEYEEKTKMMCNECLAGYR